MSPKSPPTAQFKTQVKLILRKLSKSRGVILRGLLCWAIGCLILSNDEVTSYDSRLQIRGDQEVSSQIVLITLHPSDLAATYKFRYGPLREMTDISDSYYWDANLWSDLLNKVLAQNPKSVGVTFFFSENLGLTNISNTQLKKFRDPKIIWGASSSPSERLYQPLFSNDLHTNIGAIDLLRDEDGVIRRFVPVHGEFQHLVENLSQTQITPTPHRFINYRGQGKFIEYSLRDILDERIPKEALLNKIVLIGSESVASTQYLTPLGPSQRNEVTAQILDNVLQKRWIYRANNSLYALGLLILMALSVWIIASYPQSVALVFILWMATLTAAISAWVFDLYYVWIPAVSTAIQLGATWVVFIGYQANQIERQNWELQQEQKYLTALEQLKNNFVSLISHDLKTPIAKIQAIADRLLTQNPEHQFTGDLQSLRSSSEELNRYIQSILKVLRVESRDFQLNIEVGDINEIIQEALAQLSPLAKEKQIQIETSLEPMFSIEVDVTLIREVLINLIENAIKYTPAGGRIVLTSHETPSKIHVEVADTGDGIDPNEVQNVWGKFVRGKDQNMKTKGTGLGLYLVKYFIELHGGEVFLTSELKKGTKVSFSLPLEKATEVAT